MNKKELVIPDVALNDPKALEVLRAWVANSALQCSLLPTAWEDPGEWGMLLADVARHVSNALEEDRGLKATETLARIKEIFEAELNSPTDTPTGNFV